MWAKDSSVVLEPSALLYRKFECKIIDKIKEALIFDSLSSQGQGPKCHFQNNEYRIEQFFEGRPVSVWELRNPTLFKLFVEQITAFNFNKDAIEKLRGMKTFDPSFIEVDVALKDWAPKVKARLPSIRGKLLQDNGKEHPKILDIVDKFDRNFLFKGYPEFWEGLVDREAQMVLCHNDGQENNILVSFEDN